MSYMIRWGYWFKASPNVDTVVDSRYLYANPGYNGLTGAWRWVFSTPTNMAKREDAIAQFETRQEAENVLIGGMLSGACPGHSDVVRFEDVECEINGKILPDRQS